MSAKKKVKIPRVQFHDQNQVHGQFKVKEITNVFFFFFFFFFPFCYILEDRAFTRYLLRKEIDIDFLVN